MVKVATSTNNLSRGRLDHDMKGRWDLPIYRTGADKYVNFMSNFKGVSMYKTGLSLVSLYEDCRQIKFKFSQNQSYVCLFSGYKIKFLTYDANGVLGFLQYGGSDVEVITPYSLSECRELQFDQNADVMVLTHGNHEAMDLTRTSAVSFTLAVHTTTGATVDAPDENAMPVFPVGTSPQTDGTATLSWDAGTGGSNATIEDDTSWSIPDETAAVMILDQGAGNSTKIKNTLLRYYTSGTKNINTITISGSTDDITYVELYDVQLEASTSETTKTFELPNQTAYRYTKIEVSESDSNDLYIRQISLMEDGAVANLFKPISVAFKDGRLFFGGTLEATTTIWGSEIGDYNEFTVPASILDDSPLKITAADLSEGIDWLFAGEQSLLGGNKQNLISVDGGSNGKAIVADTVRIVITSTIGSNTTAPIRKDGFMFYITNDSRHLNTFRYDLLNEVFKAQDLNLVSYDITRSGIKRLEYIRDRNDLIYMVRNDGKMLALNINEEEKIVGWAEIETEGEIKDITSIPDNEGNDQLFVLVERDEAFYIEILAPRVEVSQREEFFTDDKAADNEAYSRLIAEEQKGMNYLDNSQTYSDLRSDLITYDSGAGTITSTADQFVAGDVGKFIEYKTETGYEKGRFTITAYTSAKVVEVTPVITPTSTTYEEWYLSFNEVSGLTRFSEVSVVADGGYLGEKTVTAGVLSLVNHVTSICVGLKYTGIIKTFTLGFEVQGKNTQKSKKKICNATFRLNSSAGGKFGGSRYNLETIQTRKDGDLNYLPPNLIDGTVKRTYSDNADVDKAFYIIQDKPLPFDVCAAILETDYGLE